MISSSQKNDQSQPFLFRAENISRSLGLFLSATFAARFLGLLRGVILAWLLARSEFALLQISLLVINILNPLCSLGMHEAVVRYVPQHETRGTLRAFLSRIVPLILVLGLLGSLAVYLAAEPVGRFLFATFDQKEAPVVQPSSYIALTRLAAAATFALNVYFLTLSVLKGLRMFRVVSLMELFNNIGFTLLAVVVTVAGWPTAGAVLISYMTALLVVTILAARPLHKVVRADVAQQVDLSAGQNGFRSGAVLERMFRFSLWAAGAAVMWQTLQFFPMWYLQKIHGPEITGVFAGVRLITQAVLILAVAIVTVVQTQIFKTWETDGSAQADRQWLLAYKGCFLLLFTACAVIAAAAGPVMHIFPENYARGAGILPEFLLFFLLGGQLSFLAIHFHLIERTRHLFVPWGIGVACSVVAGKYLVLARLALPQALYAAILAGVLGMTAALLVALIFIRLERRPFDVGAVVLTTAAYALTAPIYVLLPVAGIILLIAGSTNIMFDAAGKQKIREFITGGFSQLRDLFSAGQS